MNNSTWRPENKLHMVLGVADVVEDRSTVLMHGKNRGFRRDIRVQLSHRFQRGHLWEGQRLGRLHEPDKALQKMMHKLH